MNYKPGSIIICPFCHQSTVAKTQIKIENWEKKGEILVCALCNKELPYEQSSETSLSSPEKPFETKKNEFLDFLGTTEQQLSTPVLEDDGIRRFCKNCIHYLIHPFRHYCTLHQKDVHPIEDCPDFRPRSLPS